MFDFDKEKMESLRKALLEVVGEHLLGENGSQKLEEHRELLEKFAFDRIDKMSDDIVAESERVCGKDSIHGPVFAREAFVTQILKSYLVGRVHSQGYNEEDVIREVKEVFQNLKEYLKRREEKKEKAAC